jgi:hypothetical protein
MDAFVAANPERRETLLDDRTVVVEASEENRAHALMVLDHHPVLDTLHPGLRQRLQSEQTYLALPYSVAFAHEILAINRHLNAAADAVEESDPAFARYLRLRSRDLLADDYEGGDAAWVTGDFAGNLNAQIGAYETYDDVMYGVKTFFSLSLLARDRARSEELQEALKRLETSSAWKMRCHMNRTAKCAATFRWASTTSSPISARPAAPTPPPSSRTRRIWRASTAAPS